jgi:hypothetical protein
MYFSSELLGEAKAIRTLLIIIAGLLIFNLAGVSRLPMF